MPGKKDKGNSDPTKITIVDKNGILFENDSDSVNYINNFFTNIGPDLSNKINLDNNNYLKRLKIYYGILLVWNIFNQLPTLNLKP